MLFKRSKPQPPAPQKQLSREHSLSMRPARSKLVKEDVVDGGFTRLTYLSAYKPWFAGLARRVGAWDGRPLERKLELDELGSFCWDLIDGDRTVHEMARILAERFGLPAREAELAVAAFLRELGKRGIIGVRES
ncbi:PqqD family protein [Fundidesulfovibrio putealis]|uniref:PqqD family protein n=1 Tax=Fundidesulfovibrio putealis TaxID=270496 RepID=UPI0004028696|nr:PqqD family protein [Fundidesulfovibrio putealis]